jgi:hypothetical protein
MIIGAVSNLVSSFLQPNTNAPGATSGGIQASSFALPQDSAAQISPAASLLGQLQQLQQSNPGQFQKVVTNIANKLTQAANAAQTSGNTTLANQLNQLAAQFQNSATSGQLPSAAGLQQAGLGGHHHHGGHHGGGGRSAQSSQSSLLAAFSAPSSEVQSIFSSAVQSATGTNPLTLFS